MSITVIVFLAWAILSGLFGVATLVREISAPAGTATPSGDTSLSSTSANWMVGLAILAAVLICFVLM